MTIPYAKYREIGRHHDIEPFTAQDQGDTIWKNKQDREDTDDRRHEFWRRR